MLYYINIVEVLIGPFKILIKWIGRIDLD